MEVKTINLSDSITTTKTKTATTKTTATTTATATTTTTTRQNTYACIQISLCNPCNFYLLPPSKSCPALS